MALLHLHDAWVAVDIPGHGVVKITLDQAQVDSLKAGQPTKIAADLPNGDRYENVLYMSDE